MVQILSEYKPETQKEKILKGLGSAAQEAAEVIPEFFLERKKEKEAKEKEAKQQEELFGLGEDIKKQNPDSKIHQIIGNVYQSKLPFEHKQQMVKDLTSGTLDPLKALQQYRLELDVIMRYYDNRIKEYLEQLKSSFDPDQKVELEGKINELQNQRTVMFNYYQTMKKTFDVGSEDWKEELDKVIPKETEKFEEEVKVEFDPSNPEHEARYNELYKKHLGNKRKINRDLAKEFK